MVRVAYPGSPLVSVVIAAYGRSASLNVTVATALAQTIDDVEVLVVADACPPQLIAAIDTRDPRVRVVNLPLRCGHQYGPNTVGMHLARGRYVAFLNHDDLWLDDHLEHALARLAAHHASFFLGKAAFCHRRGQDAWVAATGRLAFSEYNRPEIIWRCMDGPNFLYEPASSWVLELPLAQRVGPWRPPGTVARTPVMDWLCEAARQGARFAFGERLSVLKMNLHQLPRHDGPTYELEDRFGPQVEKLLALDAATLRRLVDEDVALAPTRGLPTRPELVTPPRADDPTESGRLAQYAHLTATGTYPPVSVDPAALVRMREEALQLVFTRTRERLGSFPPISEVLARVPALDA